MAPRRMTRRDHAARYYARYPAVEGASVERQDGREPSTSAIKHCGPLL
jgi:hypothetical protein